MISSRSGRKLTAALLVCAIASVLLVVPGAGTQKASAGAGNIGLGTPYRINQLIYPTLGNPKIITPGEQFTIEFDPRNWVFDAGAPPIVRQFQVTARTSIDYFHDWEKKQQPTLPDNQRYGISVQLPVVSSWAADSTEWPTPGHQSTSQLNRNVYHVKVTIPYTMPGELYDVQVNAQNEDGSWITDSQPHALNVVQQYKDHFSVVQLSDIHVYGADLSYPSASHSQRANRSINAGDRLSQGATYYEKEIQQINRMKPDLVVYTGDYDFGQQYLQQDMGTGWGNTTEYEYEQLWFYFETLRLDVPVLINPGNHDAYNDNTDDNLMKNFERMYGPRYHGFDYGPNHITSCDSNDWSSVDRTLTQYSIPGIITIQQPGKYKGQFRGGGDSWAAGTTEDRFVAMRGAEPSFSQQLGWIRDDLKAHESSKLRGMLFHHDPYKSGGSGSMWSSSEGGEGGFLDAIMVFFGQLMNMGNGQGRIAIMELMRNHDVAFALSGHDHSDAYGSIPWFDGKGEARFINTTSASFQADGQSAPYPGYQRIWVNNGVVESMCYPGSAHLSYPFFMGTDVGGTTDLTTLTTPALDGSWAGTPDGNASDLTYTMTNHYPVAYSGDGRAYAKFPMRYLSGGQYYRIENGTAGYIYDNSETAPTSRVVQVYATVPSNGAVAPRVHVGGTDTTVPMMDGLAINNGEASTHSLQASLSIAASDTGGAGLKDMMISNDPGFTGASWEPYAPGRTWGLTAGDIGTRTVYVKVRDMAMPANVSAPISASVEYAGPPISNTFYFAEGTCRPNFDPYICVQNPGESDAQVTITYMKGNGTTDTQALTVIKNSRSTVRVKDKLGEADDAAHDFSAKVECTNNQQIIAERPMYFNYKGVWTGGHDVVGALAPAGAFYFAEGTCRPNFDPYICIQNPGEVDADVLIQYMKGDGSADETTLGVAKHSRSTVRVKDGMGEANDAAHDFSAKVSCMNGQQIIAERPMYFNYTGPGNLSWTGGHDVIGALSPANSFYFAEGTCRPNFDPYICIQNPNGEDATVTITYMKGNGSTDTQDLTVIKNSRSTVRVKDKLGEADDAAHDFSAKVSCTNGLQIISERPMYFNYRGAWTGGHDVVGFTPPLL